jgi:hypothetical protein
MTIGDVDSVHANTDTRTLRFCFRNESGSAIRARAVLERGSRGDAVQRRQELLFKWKCRVAQLYRSFRYDLFSRVRRRNGFEQIVHGAASQRQRQSAGR